MTPRHHHTQTVRPPCPYCQSAETIRYGTRATKTGKLQLFRCNQCARRFRDPTSHTATTFPTRVIITALSLYNRGYTLDAAAHQAGKQHRLPLSKQTLATWKARYARLFPYLKLRPTISAGHSPHSLIASTRLIHGQVYDFHVHRGKLAHLQRQSGAKPETAKLVAAVTRFLEEAPTATPHEQFRQERGRASKTKTTARFNLDAVAITKRENSAIAMAQFVIPTVTSNYRRHETLQDFMLVNDTATVAVEVPVYLTATDIAHYKDQLDFLIPLSLAPDEVITGHIDILQVRGGKIHIVDYKPNATKERPIEQLMVYALALARRTGLRLLDFSCAWFDDQHYFDFSPLSVVRKHRNTQRARSRR